MCSAAVAWLASPFWPGPALVYYSGPPAEEELDQKSADIDICKWTRVKFQVLMRFEIELYFDLRWNQVISFESVINC